MSYDWLITLGLRDGLCRRSKRWLTSGRAEMEHGNIRDNILATLRQRKKEDRLNEAWQERLDSPKLERFWVKVANNDDEFVSFFTEVYRMFGVNASSQSLLEFRRNPIEMIDIIANTKTISAQCMAAQLLLKYREESMAPSTIGELFDFLTEEHPSPDFAQLVMDEVLSNKDLAKQIIERDLFPDLCSLLRRNLGLSEAEEAQTRTCPIEAHMWHAYNFAFHIWPQAHPSGTLLERFAQNVTNRYHELCRSTG